MLSLLRRHPAAIIFTVALFLRLAWIATLQDELAWIDEQEFATVAQHIAHGDGYVSTSFRANPILPYYLGAVFRLFGEHYAVARIGQAILGAVTCVIISRIGLLMFSPAVGILGGLLLAVYPPHIYLTGVFYVDCWLTFFCALAVYLAALTLEARGAPAGISVASLGLTARARHS
jgi:4-amino-4-deoxy-L-arabinose transferase-like glycosyltransferase